MLHKRSLFATSVLGAAVIALPASAEIITFSNDAGLGAEAEFTLLDPTTLEVRLRNTSTGVPDGFGSSDQILTSIAWDFGAPGADPGDPTITGGSVVIGPAGQSLNFDSGVYGPGADVSGEWGYGNIGGTGLLQNFITAMSAHATPFGGPNLDGPSSLDGPQGGLVADPVLVPLGGQGAIQDEIVALLTVSAPLEDLSFLAANAVRVEFGSDAAFITVPAPAALALLALAGLTRRRRRA